MKTKSMFLLAALMTSACGAGPGNDATSTDTQVGALGQAQVIWFGDNEVREGHLKSSGGTPKAGTTVKMEVYLQQLSGYMCRDYCAAIGPHLFVRFDGTSGFHEIPNMPKGYVPSSGGVLWDAGNEWLYHHDVSLSIPSGSDRIEAYVYWDRVSFSCVLESDETCTVNGPIDGAYLSNYGKNFRIDVTP
jgi:hypothetical protein